MRAVLARLGLELILAPWLWEMNPKMVRRRVRITSAHSMSLLPTFGALLLQLDSNREFD